MLQKDTVAVVTKKRQGDLRLKIMLTLLVVVFIYGQIHGMVLLTQLITISIPL